MVRESKNNSKCIKSSNKNEKKREELNTKKKHNESSSGSDYSSSGSDDSDYESDRDNCELDNHEYKKFLNKMFPSKHMSEKVKASGKIKKYEKLMSKIEDESEEEYETCDDDCEEPKKISKKENKNKNKIYKSKIIKKKIIVSDEDESGTDEEESAVEKKINKKNNKKSIEDKKKKSKKSTDDKKNKHKKSKDDSDESDISLGSNDTEEEYSDEDDDNTSDSDSKKKNKINMVFTIGFDGNEDEDEDIEWIDESDYDDADDETENEDDPVSETEDEESSSDEDSDEDSEDEDRKRKNSKKPKDVKKKKITENAEEKISEMLQPTQTDEEVLVKLKELYEKDKKNKTVKECIRICEEKIEKKNEKKQKYIGKVKAKHGRIFKKIMRDKNTMNDFNYFDTLDMEHQKKLIKELREINKTIRVEKPYRITLLESNIPTEFKGTAIKKINSLKHIEPGSGEYYKIKTWVDTFMRVPFGKYETLPINIDDGVDKCHEFMENAQKTLDEAVYGLNDAKMQIMQMLGQLVTNPKAIGTAIAIQGPMGTGKTTLVKEGISKILKRPFAFLALGGATDSSFLEGHSYTYEGSTWGKIVQILIDSKCMNPVIYFDELDKISDTPKGEEIIGILTHLTDTSQNSQFHDKYFAEIDFDLSKCLFIFSYNDESRVNPILRDRMYRIQTKGYDRKQKTTISTGYLLPKIREQVKFTSEQLIIPEETIHYIIENYCKNEDGVRNLKRCLEIVHTKLNLYRLMRPDTNLFEQDMSLKVEFPFTVTKQIIDKLIKKEDNFIRRSMEAMYV